MATDRHYNVISFKSTVVPLNSKLHFLKKSLEDFGGQVIGLHGTKGLGL